MEGRLRRVLPPEPWQVPHRRGHAPRRGAGADPAARRALGHPRRELQARHHGGEVGAGVSAASRDQSAPHLCRQHGLRPVGPLRGRPRVVRRARPGRVGADRHLGVRGRLADQVRQLPRRLVRGLPLGARRAGGAPLARSHGRGAAGRDGAVRGPRPRARLDVALRGPHRPRPRANRQPRPGVRALGDLPVRRRARGHRGGNKCGVPRPGRGARPARPRQRSAVRDRRVAATRGSRGRPRRGHPGMVLGRAPAPTSRPRRGATASRRPR